MADLFTRSGAVISDCGQYRYQLTRQWGDGEACTFIMLNPSTADADIDDATVRRCMDFCRRWSYDGLLILNLFAYRATNPSELQAVADPVGPENDEHILRGLKSARGPVIAAWGAHGSYMGRDVDVMHLVDRPMMCLSKTMRGAPGHPLYLPKTRQPMHFCEANGGGSK